MTENKVEYNNDINTLVIDASKRVFSELGVGHNERIYHKALIYELNCHNIHIDTDLILHEFIITFFDTVCACYNSYCIWI